MFILKSHRIKRALLVSTSFVLIVFSFSWLSSFAHAAEPEVLPSWNEGESRKSIIEFVKEVTDENSPNYVKPSERIAVFDHDGTLWCEQPMYTQVVFAIEQALARMKERPELKEMQSVKPYAAGDFAAKELLTAEGWMEAIGSLHAGMSVEKFHEIVQKWLATARQPRFKQPYTSCVYEPMLEVLAYLRVHDFKTYIVSGGGTDFMRPWTETVYGIPPEQVIGTTCKLEYEFKDNQAEIERKPKVELVDDGPGKPVGIQMFIGRRPIIAFGNSDGDFQMLQWTTSAPGKRLGLIVHHTDAEREYEYDRKSSVGHLEKALDEAKANHWVVIDMKNDWKRIFPF